MKVKWLKNENESDVILFFNGWALDEAVVETIDNKGFDIVMINDYTDFAPLSLSLEKYQHVYVVAWSMGVWAASNILSLSDINVYKSIAINGTMMPINNGFGIPERTFNDTLLFWDEDTRKRFMMRIVGGKLMYDKHLPRFGKRSFLSQISELGFLGERYFDTKRFYYHFDLAVIGAVDAIFVPKNQYQYWHNKTKIKELHIPHNPFVYFESWNQIINLLTEEVVCE